MVSSKILSLSVMALLPLALAAPAPVPETLPETAVKDQWESVNFEGKTIYINKAVLIEGSANPAEEVAQVLRRNGGPPSSDSCDGTTLDPHPAPFANTADYAVIRDWAGTQNSYFGVWDNTPDTHGVLYYGTCVFEAGTRNTFTTWIGSSNIRDIMLLAINRWQAGGVVASQGETQCYNDNSEFNTRSTVRWTIKHS